MKAQVRLTCAYCGLLGHTGIQFLRDGKRKFGNGNFVLGMTDDIQKALRMTIRLLSLGEKLGCPSYGELAQLLASNAFGKKDRISNLIKLSLETTESKTSSAPLNEALKLFFTARKELSRPFGCRADCLQSCIYDVLLCYTSFWGQVF